MKSIALNTLNYTGIVTLSQYKGKKKKIIKKIKNRGGNPLFDFFASCLIGDFTTAAKNRPTKIMFLDQVKDENNNDAVSFTSASAFIYLTTEPQQILNANGEGSTVCYSFTIPSEYFNSIFNCVGLFPDSATAYDLTKFAALAEFNLNNATFDKSTVLILDWELSITTAEASLI